MPTLVQQTDVPSTIWPFTRMGNPDYVDVFTAEIPRGIEATPEEWARAALEDAAGLGGQLLWRAALGLRLRRSPSNIGGWTIADRGAEWIRLEASSWFMNAHVVIHADDEQLTVGTFVRYDRRIAAFVWGAASVLHRRAAPYLVRDALRRVERRRREVGDHR